MQTTFKRAENGLLEHEEQDMVFWGNWLKFKHKQIIKFLSFGSNFVSIFSKQIAFNVSCSKYCTVWNGQNVKRYSFEPFVSHYACLN